MAKIIEDVVVIKFSRIAKDTETDISVINKELQSALEQVAQELVGENIIVEVEKVQ